MNTASRSIKPILIHAIAIVAVIAVGAGHPKRPSAPTTGTGR